MPTNAPRKADTGSLRTVRTSGPEASSSQQPRVLHRSSGNPAIERQHAAIEDAIKLAREQLHRAGLYAGFSDALDKAWPNIQSSGAVRSKDEVLRIARYGDASPGARFLHACLEREKRVRLAINVFMTISSGVATLADLEEFVLERERKHTLVESHVQHLRSYNDLFMGPLVRHPDALRLGLAHEGMAGMPEPRVTRSDVALLLMGLARKKKSGEPVTPEDICMELERTYQKPCRDLGVQVGARLGLLMGDIFAACRVTSQDMTRARSRLTAAVQEEAEALAEEGARMLPAVAAVLAREASAEVAELQRLAKAFAVDTAARLQAAAADPSTPPSVTAVVEALTGHLTRLLAGSSEALVLSGELGLEEAPLLLDTRSKVAGREAADAARVLKAWARLTGEEPKGQLLVKVLHSSKARLQVADLAVEVYRALEATALLAAAMRRALAAAAAQQQQQRAGLGGYHPGGGGEGEYGGRRREPVSLSRLRAALAAHNQGLSFRALAALESEAAEALGYGCWAELGRGQSLLAALAEHHELASALLDGGAAAAAVMLSGGGAGGNAGGGGGGGGPACWEDVLALAAMVLAARRRQAEDAAGSGGAAGPRDEGDDEGDGGAAAAVEVALMRQFRVPCVAALGFGPLRRLLAEAEATAAAGALGGGCAATSTAASSSASAVLPELGIAALPSAGVGTASSQAADVVEGLVGRELAAAAADCLDAAPMLAELGEWSQWEEVFGPRLGPLKSYIQRGSDRQLSAGWRAVEAPGGRLFKVPAGLGLEGCLQLFRRHLARLDAPGMAAALLAAAADAGGLELAPLKYLESLVEEQWEALRDGAVPSPEGAARSGDPRVGPRALLRCCLDCLAAIPLRTLRRGLAERVLLPPLENPRIVGRGWRDALLKAATKPEQSAVLHQLGLDLGVVEWCRDWAARRVPPPAAAQPTPGPAPAQPDATAGGGDAPSSVPAPTATESPAKVTTAQDGPQAGVSPGGERLGSPAAGAAGEPGGSTAADAGSAHVAGSALAPEGPNGAHVTGDKGEAEPFESESRGEAADALVAGPAAGEQQQGPEEVEALRHERALVVERIRHTYGVDKVFTDPDAVDTIRCNTQRVGNAVEQLSAQLYSKDLHFVMELLQNAEDNSYPAGATPCLEFVLTPDALVVLNNEIGFKEADIRALSDVNMSTKKKKRGYIGKKGIGFKSVFKVSDAPEVHSNGFHVAFSRTLYGNLGMVLPSVVPPYDGADLPSQLGLVPARTVIRLPLNVRNGSGGSAAQAAAAVVESLRKPLSEVDPRLLLFLKKLRSIAVTDAATAAAKATAHARDTGDGGSGVNSDKASDDSSDDEGSDGGSEGCGGGHEGRGGLSVQVHKRELGAGQVALRYGPVGRLRETRWLIVSDTFTPTVDRGDLSVSELGETEVSLAFDLGAAAEVAEAAEAAAVAAAVTLADSASGNPGVAALGRAALPLPPQQEVFAYLPTRNYGLRFMVNADFIVTTSREAIDSGSGWNQMLVARIPQLFARSLQELQRLDAQIHDTQGQEPEDGPGDNGLGAACSTPPHMPPHGWLNYWLSCIPLPHEPQDLFAPLPHRIAECARGVVLLPTACGQMLSPARHQLRVCTDPGVRELLAEPGMQTALRSAGLFFVSEAVAPLHAHPRLRSLLGVHDFQAQDMVTLLETLLATRGSVPADAAAAGDRAGADEAECNDSEECPSGSTSVDEEEAQTQTGADAAPSPLSLGLLARLLVLFFRMLGAGAGAGTHRHGPSGQGQGRQGTSQHASALGSGNGGAPGAERLWASLRRLHVLPVLSGGRADKANAWIAAEGSGAHVFLLPGSEGDADGGGGGARDAPTSSGAVAALLDAVGLPPDLRPLLQPLEPRAGAGYAGPACTATSVTGRTAASTTAAAAAPRRTLRFLDPALAAQLPPGPQRGTLLAGLRELGVRQLEAADVYDLAVLPLLRAYSDELAAAQDARPQDVVGADAAPAALPPLHAATLVACLAFPLAAGLLGAPEPQAGGGGQRGAHPDARGRAAGLDRQKQEPRAAGDAVLEELRSCAVVLTRRGTIVRCPHRDSDGAAGSAGQSGPRSGRGPAGRAAAPEGEGPGELFLPSALCPGGLDLVASFPNWYGTRQAAVISDSYLRCGAVRQQDWAWLFRRLGATPFLRLRPRTVYLWLGDSASLPPEAQRYRITPPAQAAAPQLLSAGALPAPQPFPRFQRLVAMELPDSPWRLCDPAAAADTRPCQEPSAPAAQHLPPLPPCPPGSVYRLEDVSCPSLEDLLDSIVGPQLKDAAPGIDTSSLPLLQPKSAAAPMLPPVLSLSLGLRSAAAAGPNAAAAASSQRPPQPASAPPTPLSAGQVKLLESLAAALEAVWEEERYGEGLVVRQAVTVLAEEEALEEMAARAAEGGGRRARDGREGSAAGGGGGGGGGAAGGQVAVSQVPSSFLLTLQTRRWLPTSQGHAVTPSEALPRLQKLVDMFGDAPLPFLTGPSPAPGGPLASALGLPRHLTPQLVIALLRRLAAGGDAHAGGGGGSCSGSAGSTVAAVVPTFAAALAGAPAAAKAVPTAAPAVSLDPERMCRVYRYLGAAGQQADGEGVFAAVCAAFKQWPLIWLPDAPVASSGAGTKRGACRGRFHAADRVALCDPTGVLEAALGQDGGAAEAASRPPVRILEGNYPQAVLSFFEELCDVRPCPASAAPQHGHAAHVVGVGGWGTGGDASPAGGVPRWALLPEQPLLARQPSLDDYVAALERVAAREEVASARAMQQVRAIIQPWADGLASGSLPADGPLAARLRLLLPPRAVFPTAAGGWASVAGGLLLNDSRELARLFGRAPGVHVLDASFSGQGGAAEGGSGGSLEPLLQLLRLPRLSLCVREEVEYEGLRAGWVVERLVRISLTFAQRYLLHARPDLYAHCRELAAARLPRLQVFVVQKASLQVRHVLVHPDGRKPVAAAEGPQPRAAVLQLRDGGAAAAAGEGGGKAPWLLVDDVRNYHKVCDELSRLFTPGGLPDAQLASFLMCLMLSHEKDEDPQRDTRREAAELYACDQGCRPLPEGEPVWEVPLGMLQQESAAAAAVAAAPAPAAVEYALPEHDLDALLAEAAPQRPQPKAVAAAAAAGTAAAQADGAEARETPKGGHFNPYLDASGGGPGGGNVNSGIGGGGGGVGGGGGGGGGGGFAVDGVSGATAATLDSGGLRMGSATGDGGQSNGDAQQPTGRSAAAGDGGGDREGEQPAARLLHRGLGHWLGVGAERHQRSPDRSGRHEDGWEGGGDGGAGPYAGDGAPGGYAGGAGAPAGPYAAHFSDGSGHRLQWLRLPDLLAAGGDGSGEELLAALGAAVTAAGGEVLPDGADGDAAAGVSREAAARWAEALVFELLRRDASLAAAGWAVEWVSGREDMRHAPYDIVMTRDSAPGCSERMYVEVKSSTSASKRTFEISTQELSKAQQERESYVIFRVLGVGRLDSLELLVLADPWAMCARKELRLCVLTA